MRQPKPFYRKQTRKFYVQIDGKQIDLGADEAEAHRRWHLLMAGVDESVIEAMNEPVASEPKQDPITIHKLVKSHLGWQASEKDLAPRTKVWYRERFELACY
jgi:hypothetical protein